MMPLPGMIAPPSPARSAASHRRLRTHRDEAAPGRAIVASAQEGRGLESVWHAEERPNWPAANAARVAGLNAGMADHYVYLYRTPAGVPKYVGYGTDPARAMSHAGASHNVRLREWLEGGHLDLVIAGPYRDELEGKHVEAALISALSPEFNLSPGDGPRFLPVGVPSELGDRPALPPLSAAELGQLTGGALLVYLAPGDFLRDGRRKYDPAAPSDEDVLSNMRGVWDIGRHLEGWTSDPKIRPAGARRDSWQESALPLHRWSRQDRHIPLGRPGASS
jgi:hypothetical protein